MSSKKKSENIENRKKFLIKSYQEIKKSTVDTFGIRSLSDIAYQYFKLGDTSLFKKRNKEAFEIARDVKDTFALGDLHWNFASFYNKKETYDSAYYHFNIAYNYFEKVGYLYGSAKTQHGMAFIKGRFKDYSGSEVLTFKAISKFEKLNNYKSLYACYDHLGQLQNDIYEYDRAIFYYNKALQYYNKINNNSRFYEATLNNIGNTYLKKEEYTKALKYYDKVLNNDDLKFTNVDHYARVLDNKAYCKLLMKDTTNVISIFNKALKIRDSIDNKSGVIISKIHLAHYYNFLNDTISAISNAKEANYLAKEIKNSRDYLESLLLLAKLEVKNSSIYFNRHIQFSDSLQIEERKTHNKFTRIAYETDEYIEENKRLSQQKIIIILVSIGVILIAGLLYSIKNQKSKTEKVLLEYNQQKANEQIYLLTLKQQEKLEKEKVKERNRIAEELHDGILGKLFGTRLGLGFLNISENKDIKKQYELFLEELQIIEKDIREVSHKISDNFDSSQINFISIVDQLVRNKSKIGNFETQLDFDENINWYKINEIVKVNLYRIAQEALLNIIKYSSAKKVQVSFKIVDNSLEFLVKDDGIGFNIKQKKKGIGIKNMKSRVEKLKGDFNIQSTPKIGTVITIRIPK
ncbi:tetratricopeptide repeat protein [Psychroserpens sp. AS72]|uniref:tetratricopeptide repeat-containing sensor histidine kinase n=1 Tax=Psychroserpens sp. AS72 TaxID=3135775 RepID=UPI0031790913